MISAKQYESARFILAGLGESGVTLRQLKSIGRDFSLEQSNPDLHENLKAAGLTVQHLIAVQQGHLKDVSPQLFKSMRFSARGIKHKGMLEHSDLMEYERLYSKRHLPEEVKHVATASKHGNTPLDAAPKLKGGIVSRLRQRIWGFQRKWGRCG